MKTEWMSPAGRTRSETRRLFDMFAAYTRIDVIEDCMFPVSTVLRYVAVQLRDVDGRVLAQWALLSNVPKAWATA